MIKMSKWNVETNPLRLRRLGKLSEELGELQAVVSRCIIQGIDETDPSSLQVNRARLQEEIADVLAQCICTVKTLELNHELIIERSESKQAQMAEWESYFTQPKE